MLRKNIKNFIKFNRYFSSNKKFNKKNINKNKINNWNIYSDKCNNDLSICPFIDCDDGTYRDPLSGKIYTIQNNKVKKIINP